MSTISASTTSTTGFKVTSDTTGTLVFQTGASPTTAMSISSAQIISFTNPPTATGGGSVSTNTAYGTSALAANTTGASNTAAGVNALSVNTIGNYNTAFGANAARYQTNNNNIAIGYNAMLGVSGSSNGGSDIAIGSNALAALTSGNYNIAIGQQALQANTTASGSTSVGYQAGYTNQTGNYNTFIGYGAGYTSNVSGNAFNTAVGTQAGNSLTTGTNNTFVGCGPSGLGAGFYITSGSKNIILGGYNGNQGGLDIRTASNYIVLSDGDGNPRCYWHPSYNAWISYLSGMQSGNTSIANGASATITLLSAVTSGMFNLVVERQDNANINTRAMYFASNRYGSAPQLTSLASHNGSAGGVTYSISTSSSAYQQTITVTNSTGATISFFWSYCGYQGG